LLAGQLLAGFAVNTARKAAGLPVLPGSGGNNQEAQGQQKQQEDRQGQTGPPIPPGRQLNGKVPIGAVLLTGDPRNAMSGEIAASVRTNLQGSKEVSLLSEETVPQNDPAQVPAVLQKVLSAHGSSVQAVLATDSRLAVAAVQALKSAGLNNRVLTAGVGADEESSRALESGDHDAEIDTRPDLLGQFALDAAISLVKGDRWQYDGRTSSGSYSVPSRITPVRLIQGDNVYLLKQQWKGLGGGSEKKEGGDSGDSGQSQGSGDGQKQGSGNEGGQQGSESKGDKTTLRITTQDGKTMEVEIDGKVKKIESTDGGKDGQQGTAEEGR
jgi:ABC-type sugar transport system substrate-binding protein